jgi:quercetin dioxygenase-like cupin family protein
VDTAVKIRDLSDFTGGWFIGNFEPSLIKTEDFECAVKRYKAGDSEEEHYHAAATEITAVLSGIVEMCGMRHKEGTIAVLEPNEATAFRAVTDAVTAVIKIPSVIGDKFYGKPSDAGKS